MRIPNLITRKNLSGVSRKHLNRRGRRDAEASAAPIPAGTIETLEGRTMMSVSLDAQGWTVVGPASDSRVVYVSRSGGDDGNSGLSASSPVKSLAQGESLLRNGSADQLLLKRGDTWYESFGNWDKSGRSDDEPMLIGTYGSGAAPLLKTGTANGITTGNTPISHLFIQGIHFNASSRDAGTGDYKGSSGGSYGLQALSKLHGLTIEGAEFENYRMNVSIQRYFGEMTDVTLRRNVIQNAWSTSTGGHSQGLYVTGVNGIVLEENIFDHNGWNEKASGSDPTIFNHNVYMRQDNTGVVVRGNVFSNAASHGLQARSGGLIKDNLFLNNPIQMSFGMINGSPGTPGGVTGAVEGNVFLGGRDLDGRGYGWGLELGNLKRDGNTTVRDNIFAHDTQNTTAAIMLEYGRNIDNVSEITGLNDLTIEDNVVYRWNRAINSMGGMVPGSTGYRGINDLVVRDNEFSAVLSERMISHAQPYSRAEESWSNNNYFDADSSSSAWFTVNGQAYSLSKWRAEVEPTARSSNPGYKDASRGAGTYMESIGGAGSVGGFLSAAKEMVSGTFKAKYAAAAVINYVRAGFNRGSDQTTPEPTPTPAPTPAPAPTPEPPQVVDYAPVAVLQASPMTEQGKWQTFAVEYKDDDGININSLGSGDVRVVGFNGWDLGVKLKNVAKTATGAVATYAVTTPAGNWDAADNGTYTVVAAANQVKDGAGSMLPAGPVGTIKVAIEREAPKPAPLKPAVSNAPARVVSARLVTPADGKQILEFTFSRNVGKSLSLKDFDVFNAQTGRRIAKYAMSLSYDASRNTASLKFVVPLREGAWRANVWAGGVWDGAGNNLDGNGNGKDGDHFTTKFTV